MKKLIIFVLLIVLCVNIMSACSYKKIEDSISRGFTTEKIEETVAYNTADEQYRYVEQGDSFPDYFKYTIKDYGYPDEYVEYGIRGLIYTFNNVQIFESIYDSPISKDECYQDVFEPSVFGQILENNAFLLVDITASYDSQNDDSSDDEIMFRMEFEGDYHFGDNYKGYSDDDFFPPYTNPVLIYFSEHPQIGDVDLEGEPIDLINDANVCRTILKNGDSLSFQIGIVSKKELIEDKNIFLYMHHLRDTQEKSNPVISVDLLGRFKND